MAADLYEEACVKLKEFIDMGAETTSDEKTPHKLMDWEQDANLIIPAINRVMGQEIRLMEYVHWWTFIGAYMEIGECNFSQVVNIRSKKNKGKKLEKWEREYMEQNKDIVLLQPKLTEEEKEQEKRLKDIF